ncbi:MAG: hypothetical protein HY901_19360, partial [Deltaproteobacteria bacterium]|nr:hypothetical protein [Deltaproteobacteria bacterium]
MPPSASKNPLSPTELAQLEHAFATDPTSEAYKPLAEAYLAMGRFMEAMVVCKKGVKAHPETVTARVLLARVYAEQGKDKKALEELQGALLASPNDLHALRLLGSILCKSGDTAQGAEHLKKAIAADPKDPETLELCKKYSVAVPAPEPPPPPPPPVVVAPPVLTPAAPARDLHAGVGAVAQPGMQTPVSAHPARAAQPAQRNPQAAPRAAQPRPAPRPAAPRVSFEELSEKYDREDSLVSKKKGGMTGLIITVSIILAGGLALGGFFMIRKANEVRDGKIAKLLKGIQDELAHDSFASYKKACDYGSQIVSDLDSQHYPAHAFLAYGYAIRWGEHGEDVQERAKEHLAKAKAAKQEHSHIHAAEAYIRFFGGDAKGAEDWLAQIVEDAEKSNKKSTLLMSVLGILQMHSGDLEKAYKNLKAAQTLLPADPRINAALG